MARVFIGIGTNEGDRLANISRAVRAMGALPEVRLVQMATVIETEPVGGPPQDPYLNTVVEIETALEPAALLAALQEIERRLGRVRSAVRWSSRPMDLDLLCYGDRRIDTPALQVPHPWLHERRFALEPLAQLAPELVHPRLGRTIAELLAQLKPIPHSQFPILNWSACLWW